MSIFFSRQCEYALQAVMYLALSSNGESTSIKELTEKLQIPYHFLAKILQDLTYKGLLESHKGPAGGFKLRKNGQEITALQIVEAIDGVDFKDKCLLGFPDCSSTLPCAAHEKWHVLREEIYGMLANKKITDMAREMKKQEYSI
jgi:Rrf2 family protein